MTDDDFDDYVFQRLSETISTHPKARQKTSGRTTGKGYDTDGWGYQWVADKLNEVLGVHGWTLQVREREHHTFLTHKGKKEMFSAVVLVRISLTDGSFRECFGGHDSRTLADALKGALTNGFKKCAAMFGAGADAYRGQMDPDNETKAEDDRDRMSSNDENRERAKIWAEWKKLAPEGWDKPTSFEQCVSDVMLFRSEA